MADKKVDFEAALNELEALVDSMESGELTLDESLKTFKRGVTLTRQCQELLASAQQTVEQLMDPEDESTSSPVDA